MLESLDNSWELDKELYLLALYIWYGSVYSFKAGNEVTDLPEPTYLHLMEEQERRRPAERRRRRHRTLIIILQSLSLLAVIA